MTNSVQKFLLNNLDVRGVIVHLDSEWQELLSRRSYDKHINELLGQATAATLLMSANVKFEGNLLLQLQSQGDLSLLLVQANNHYRFRALAKYHQGESKTLKAMTPEGVIAIVIEADIGEEPYQGLVSIDADVMAENLETYFNQSEQLQTLLVLRADNEQAAGILLQVLPNAKIGDDDWTRLRHLAETLNLAELKTVGTQTMIKRMFAEDDKTVYEAMPAAFECGCSDERTLAMLASLDENELSDIVESQEDVVVACDFCGKQYQHDAATITALLSNKIHPN
ncbi:MAG: redox-regulated molecular chaperone Hsp33 [Gammaproteobacteria bacterium]|nr:MAG: redox-regulated molecular chaperone Hsp33 [Gammaproteobacteria bacterium]